MATPTTPAPAAPSPAQAPGTKAPAQGAAPAAPAAAPPRMITLKLDGKDVQMPESEVISYAQQGKVAGQRFQEAAALKKQAEEILAFGKANPKEFLAKMGMNPRQWAEEYLMQELQVEAMSPEQKKARENEEKLRKFEDNEKKTKEKAQQDEKDRLTNQKREEFDVMFTEALGLSGLPKTPFTVKRMAELQLINLRKNLELNASQLAKIVREDYAAEHKALFGAIDGDQLMDMLGPDIVKKLSKAQISKLKAKGVQPAAGGARPPAQSGKPPMTWAEYHRKNRKIG